MAMTTTTTIKEGGEVYVVCRYLNACVDGDSSFAKAHLVKRSLKRGTSHYYAIIHGQNLQDKSFFPVTGVI